MNRAGLQLIEKPQLDALQDSNPNRVEIDASWVNSEHVVGLLCTQRALQTRGSTASDGTFNPGTGQNYGGGHGEQATARGAPTDLNEWNPRQEFSQKTAEVREEEVTFPPF